MADFPVRADLFRIARDTALVVNARLSAEAIARDGSDANVLVAVSSAMGDKVLGQLILVASGLYLDSAQSQRLDRLVFDRYGLVRKPAAPALVNVAFTLTTPAVGAFAIPVGTILSTSSGAQFVTIVASSMAAGSTGPVYVLARSILAGADQQIKAGDIKSIVTPPVGSPSDLAVTNNAASAGAADRETDDQLRDRARRFWVTAQRGTLTAIETGALATPGVVRATAIEVADGNARPGRWVLLAIADSYTDALASVNETSLSYQAQSQGLAAAVFQNLNEYRCGGMFVQVVVAQVVLLQFTLSLTFAAGVDTLVVANRARAIIVDYVNNLAPGQAFIPVDALQRLRQVAGLVITGNEIQVPAGPVIPKVLQALRCTTTLVNASAGGLPIANTVDPDTLVVQLS